MLPETPEPTNHRVFEISAAPEVINLSTGPPVTRFVFENPPCREAHFGSMTPNAGDSAVRSCTGMLAPRSVGFRARSFSRIS